MLKIEKLGYLGVVGDKELSNAYRYELASLPAERFVAYLVREGLNIAWFYYLCRHPLPTKAGAELHEQLRTLQLSSIALGAAQDRALFQIHQEFEINGIHYATFKGAWLRRTVYADSLEQHTAGDIDLLVSHEDLAKAGQSLRSLGFKAMFQIGDHEIAYRRGVVEVDLHWRILPRYKARTDPSEAFLAARVKRGGVWGLDVDAHTAILLAHPLLTNRLHTRGERLPARMLHLKRWLDHQHPDWSNINAKLEKMGVRSAAWAMLALTAHCLGTGKLPGMDQLAPSPRRQSYLRAWVESRLPRWLTHNLMLNRFGFSLALYDQPIVGLRALAYGGWSILRRRVHRTMLDGEH